MRLWGGVWVAAAALVGVCFDYAVAQEEARSRHARDTVLLAEMLQRVRDGEYENIHSVLILQDDSLILEEYFDRYEPGTPHQIRSATKAIGSILVGIAIDRGFLPSEDVLMYRFFDEDYEPAYGWTEPARSIRIRDFLSMTSGYDCDDLATPAFECEHAMYETNDWVRYALDLPIMHPRGAHWAYNSSSLILVGEAIARSSDMSLAEFANTYLFRPLGIEHFQWETSPRGRAWMGGGARAVPRDMLKIGRLMSTRGVWEGRRLLSERWIEMSTSPQAEYHAGVEYGFIWQIGQFFQAGELIPAYWASGNGGQYIVVFPDHDLVAVFTGGNYDSPLANQPFEMLDRYILPALLDSPVPGSVTPSSEQLEQLVGTYHLDFEPAATCTVDVDGRNLRVLTPDQEYVELHAHSPNWFSGDSAWGTINLVFEAGRGSKITTLTIYGQGSRYVFEKQKDEG